VDEPIEKTLNDSLFLLHMEETHPDTEIPPDFFATRPYLPSEIQAIRDSEIPEELKQELISAHWAYEYWYMWLGPSLCKDQLKEIRRIEAEIKKLPTHIWAFAAELG